MPSLTRVPPRFSYAAFSRYETVIEAVLATYPADFTIDCDKLGFSGETVSCRLRDAAKAYQTYKYNSAIINRAEFERVWPQLQVCNRGNTVIVRVRGSASSSLGQQLAQTALEIEPPLALTEPELDAILLLLHHKRITNRVQINDYSLDYLQTKIAALDYDIGCVEDDGKVYIL